MSREYNPRNRNRRVNEDDAPYSWAQRFYDAHKRREPSAPCGFAIPEKDR